MGDINYRVNKTMEEIEDIYKNKKEMSLLEYDQMNYEIKNYNLKMSGFKEGKIDFLPTYKYSDDYKNEIVCDMQEHIPSWTDRIFYKINENKVKYEEKSEINKYKEEKPIVEDDKEENVESDDYEEEDGPKDNKKEYLNEIYFKLIKYNSMQNIVYSDHKPVYAYFDVNIK